jgi:hypothetical protein
VSRETGGGGTKRASGTWLAEGSSSVQQQALLDFDRALANWRGKTHRRPRWRKKGEDEGFCVRDVTVRRLNRRWATVERGMSILVERGMSILVYRAAAT